LAPLIRFADLRLPLTGSFPPNFNDNFQNWPTFFQGGWLAALMVANEGLADDAAIGAGSVNPDGRAYRLIDASSPAALPEAWIEFLKFKLSAIRERATAAVNARRLARTIQQGGGSSAYPSAIFPDCCNRGAVQNDDFGFDSASTSLATSTARRDFLRASARQFVNDPAQVLWPSPSCSRLIGLTNGGRPGSLVLTSICATARTVLFMGLDRGWSYSSGM